MPSARLPLLALALAACAAPPPEPAGDYTRALWKAGTTLQTRAADTEACELAAIGAIPATPQPEIRARAAATSPEAHHDRTLACMQARGYAWAEFPVCSPAERAAGRLTPIASPAPLPPRDRVACLVPEPQGFIAR